MEGGGGLIEGFGLDYRADNDAMKNYYDETKRYDNGCIELGSSSYSTANAVPNGGNYVDPRKRSTVLRSKWVVAEEYSSLEGGGVLEEEEEDDGLGPRGFIADNELGAHFQEDYGCARPRKKLKL